MWQIRYMNGATSAWSVIVATMIALHVFIGNPSVAAAEWNFNPQCGRSLTTHVETPAKPNALLMLDQSGSMGFLYDSSGRNTLWTVAVNAINQTVNAMQSEIRFGLGLFPAELSECKWLPAICNGTTNCEFRACPIDRCATWLTTCRYHNGSTFDCTIDACTFRDGATEVMAARDNAYTRIRDALANTYPEGGTPTRDAMQKLYTSISLNHPDHPAAGVLITDGQPNPGTENAAIQEACAARSSGYTNFIVGLGGATDQNYNNKLAAAAGTGCCGSGANSSCSNGIGTDPCTNPNISANSCYGAHHANNQTEFRNALLSITGQLSCTFPIDVSQFSGGSGPDDPRAVKVELNWAEGLGEAIPHRDASSDRQGWYFANTERTAVTLTEYYCNQAAAGHIGSVTTTVGCPCPTSAPGACTVRNPPPGICSEGVETCSMGFQDCEPLPPGLCPVPCPGWPIGEDCHVDNPVTPSLGGPHNLAHELNRCKMGELECIDNEPVCVPKFNPMPEVCNGLDNDCDGVVGNISESWSKDWSQVVGAGYTPDAPACYGQDLCRCRVHVGEHAGEGETLQEEFDDYMRNFVPGDDAGGCICVEN